MAAPEGNDFKVKFKTPEERQALCQAWCEHLSEGLSKESFAACDPQTFRKYVDKYPEDFDTDKIAEAERMGRSFWEQTGIDGLWNETTYNDQGKPQASRSLNAAVWCFNMKNRYGWRDKHDVVSDNKHEHTGKMELDVNKANDAELMDYISNQTSEE